MFVLHSLELKSVHLPDTGYVYEYYAVSVPGTRLTLSSFDGGKEKVTPLEGI